MDVEVVERAAEPFFTTKEVGKGSGLGLSQVYGFAAQSGGFVQLHSEPAKGTKVAMHLPATAASPAPTTTASTTAPTGTGARNDA